MNRFLQNGVAAEAPGAPVFSQGASKGGVGDKYVPDGFNDFFFWAGLVLFHLTLVLLIVRVILDHKGVWADFKSPEGGLTYFLIPAYYGLFGIYLFHNNTRDISENIVGLNWVHLILFLLLLCFQVWFWMHDKQSRTSLGVIAVSLAAITISFCLDQYRGYRQRLDITRDSDSASGWSDLSSWYMAIGVFALLMFINLILASLREADYKRTPLMDTLSYSMIAVLILLNGISGGASTWGQWNVFSFNGEWFAITLAVVLVVALVLHIIQNKKGSDLGSIMLCFGALSLLSSHFIAVTFRRNRDDLRKFHFNRIIYGPIALILLWLGFLFSLLMIVLYFMVIFFGSSKKSTAPRVEA